MSAGGQSPDAVHLLQGPSRAGRGCVQRRSPRISRPLGCNSCLCVHAVWRAAVRGSRDRPDSARARRSRPREAYRGFLSLPILRSRQRCRRPRGRRASTRSSSPMPTRGPRRARTCSAGCLTSTSAVLAFGRPGPWRQDVIVRLDARQFPEAFAPEGREALADLRAAAEALAREGAARRRSPSRVCGRRAPRASGRPRRGRARLRTGGGLRVPLARRRSARSSRRLPAPCAPSPAPTG